MIECRHCLKITDQVYYLPRFGTVLSFCKGCADFLTSRGEDTKKTDADEIERNMFKKPIAELEALMLRLWLKHCEQLWRDMLDAQKRDLEAMLFPKPFGDKDD